MKTRLWTTALLVGSAMALPAAATPIASDSFDSYSTGALAGNNGGTGWGGAWATVNTFANTDVVAGGLSYSAGDVNINGGAQSLLIDMTPGELSGISDGLLSRALGSSQTGTVYMSLLFRDAVNPDLPATDFVQWGFDTGTTNPNTSVMRRNGTFQSRSTTTSSNSADSGISTAVGQTFLLVMKAQRTGTNYDNIALYLNPTTLTEPVSADAVATANSGIASLDNFVSRSAFHELGDAFQIDAISIGTAYEDVVVPEPTSLALLAMGGLLAARRRRRAD